MGHGGVADEIKGRRPGRRRQPAGAAAADHGSIFAIEEEGVRFRSYVDGSERFLGPETSMAVQAALHSDIALVFDECTPFHVSRDYIARSMERTHRWLERCLDWHEQRGPGDQAVYGIVQGGTEHDLRLESTAAVAASGCDGIAIGGSLGPGQGADVRGGRLDDGRARTARPRSAPPPARHRRDRRPDRRRAARGSTRSTARCRPVWPATAWRSSPIRTAAGAWTWSRAACKRSPEPILDGCPCPACAQGFSRAYLHYLLRAHELTGMRLVTLHNLSFIARLMADLRAAIDDRAPARGAARRPAPAPPRGASAALLRVLVDQRADLIDRRLGVVGDDLLVVHDRVRGAVGDQHGRDHDQREHGEQRQERRSAGESRARTAAAARSARGRPAFGRGGGPAGRRAGGLAGRAPGAGCATGRSARGGGAGRSTRVAPVLSPRGHAGGGAGGEVAACRHPAGRSRGRRRGASRPAASRCRAAPLVDRQRHRDRLGERVRHLGDELVERHRGLALLLERQLGQRVGLIGQPAGDQLVGDDAERVQVGARAGLLAAGLLGRRGRRRCRAPSRPG